MAEWTKAEIPDQSGRLAVVTGSNTGIGFETALALAEAGCDVVLACRNEQKAEDAVTRITAQMPRGEVEFMSLDLSKLSSVQAFVAEFLEKHKALDLLINNAGVMIPPESRTEEGFELQIGVNFIGHFTLTAGLMPALEKETGARVVTVSSLAHRAAKIRLNTFRGEQKYNAWREYCQSKLADLMFSLELDRRLKRSGSKVIATAAHPGGTKTDLQRHSGFIEFATNFGMMPADQGALPTLFAATSETLSGGEYIGPDGLFEIRGYPKHAKVAKAARDLEVAAKLWKAGEDASGSPFLAGFA